MLPRHLPEVPHRLHTLKNPLVRRYCFGVSLLFALDERLRWETRASDLYGEWVSHGWCRQTLFLHWDVSISMNYERMRSCANKLAPERELGSDFAEGVGENWGCCQGIKPFTINLGHCKWWWYCEDSLICRSSPQVSWWLSNWSLSAREEFYDYLY